MATTTAPSLTARGKALAERTGTAYSYDRYASWPALAIGLLRYGYTEREAEAILRSKWTRWAADAIDDRDRVASRHGHTPAKRAVEWIGARLMSGALAELVTGTFGHPPVDPQALPDTGRGL